MQVIAAFGAERATDAACTAEDGACGALHGNTATEAGDGDAVLARESNIAGCRCRLAAGEGARAQGGIRVARGNVYKWEEVVGHGGSSS